MKSILQSVRTRKRFEDEMNDELRFHVEERSRDLEAQGLSAAEAQCQARKEFGSMERFREECRQAGGLSGLDEIRRHLLFATRIYLRERVFTVTVLLTLGICIGATTAVFSVVDAVLWRPLPYPQPERLFLVSEDTGELGDLRFTAHGGATWEVVRDHAEVLDRAVYSGWIKGVNLAAGPRVAFVQQQRVSDGFFRVLGVPPLVGREFSSDEVRPGGAAVTILSHDLWASLFQSESSIVGETILLKGEPFQVVGIMPRSFASTDAADLWTPLQASRSGEGEGRNYTVIGRLKEGVGREQAEARLAGLDLNALSGRGASEHPRKLSLIPLREALTDSLRRPLLMLFSAVLTLLLVGCANLASLLLARAVTRRQEMATRIALGGGARSVFRQLMVETLLLGFGGGLVGLLLAFLGLTALEQLMRENFGLWQTLNLDWRVVGATFGLSLAASVFFGLAPAVQLARTDFGSILASAGRGAVGTTGHWPRRLFIAGEVALVVSLLFTAGLLLRSYFYLEDLPPGFNSDQVLTAQFSLEDARYRTQAQIGQLFEGSLSRIRGLPGVQSAGVALTLPYQRALNLGFGLPGETLEQGSLINLIYVTPGFFETLQIGLLAGRLPATSDTAESTAVVFANRIFLDSYLAQREPLGRTIAVSGVERQLVGVVGNALAEQAGWGDPEPLTAYPTLYVPVAQLSDAFFKVVHTWFSPTWVVRYQGPGEAATAGIRNVFREVDPLLPIADVRPAAEILAQSLSRESFQAFFLLGLAGVSLLLAAVGLYGLVAGSVTERTGELGVRLALGATPAQALGAVALPGIWLGLLGLAAGALLCLLTGPLVEHLIWGVRAGDPVTFLVAALSLMAAVSLASLVPALRVLRLSPAETLRGQ